MADNSGLGGGHVAGGWAEGVAGNAMHNAQGPISGPYPKTSFLRAYQHNGAASAYAVAPSYRTRSNR